VPKYAPALDGHCIEYHLQCEIGIEEACIYRDMMDRIILQCLWLDNLIDPWVILRLNGKIPVNNDQRRHVRTYRPVVSKGESRRSPLLADRLLIISTVDELGRITFRLNFLLFVCLTVFLCPLAISTDPRKLEVSAVDWLDNCTVKMGQKPMYNYAVWGFYHIRRLVSWTLPPHRMVLVHLTR
jgi:hypothetical protein